MGTFLVQIELGDPEGPRYGDGGSSGRFGGDTHHSSGLDPAEARRIPSYAGQIRLADRSRIERDIGRTWLKLEEGEQIVPVIFGDEDSQPLLVAVTLGIFRLGVDPVSQRLIPVPGPLMVQRR